MIRAILLCFVIRATVKNADGHWWIFPMYKLSHSCILLEFIVEMLVNVLLSWMMTLCSVGKYKL